MNGPLRAELAQVASALDLPVARLHAIAVTALLASYHASGRRLILPLHPATT